MPTSDARRQIGVAIGVPDPYGAQLQGWRELLGDPAAVQIPPHVTLLPPTVTAGDGLAAVDRHLAEVAAAATPFELRLRGPGTFRPVSPVVFVAVADGAAACAALAAAVRSGPLARPARFPYHPHVTVAHDLPDDALDRAYAAMAGFEARFGVAGFTRFERDPDGVWRPRREFPFGAAPAASAKP